MQITSKAFIGFALICCCLFTMVRPVAAEAPEGKPKKLLLIGQSPDGHPRTTHEFMAGLKVIEALVKDYPEIETQIVKADDPWNEGPDLISEADGIVLMLSQGSRWMQTHQRRLIALDNFAKRGGAIVALHWSIGAKDEKYIPGQLHFLGGTRGGEQRRYTVLEKEVVIVDPKHPIMQGVSNFRVHDEFYYKLDFVKTDPKITPLMQVNLENKDETVGWAWERKDGGRSFSYVGFHFHKNWELPEYRRIVLQSILWTLKMEVPEGGVKVDIDSSLIELPPAPKGSKTKRKKTAPAAGSPKP